jgi:hypothetical protein
VEIIGELDGIKESTVHIIQEADDNKNPSGISTAKERLPRLQRKTEGSITNAFGEFRRSQVSVGVWKRRMEGSNSKAFGDFRWVLRGAKYMETEFA